MTNIIIGILMIVAGALIVIKSEVLYNAFGMITFFEEKMGAGSSRFGYKLIGLIVLLLGTLALTGLWTKIFVGIFGRFFTGFGGLHE